MHCIHHCQIDKIRMKSGLLFAIAIRKNFELSAKMKEEEEEMTGDPFQFVGIYIKIVSSFHLI